MRWAATLLDYAVFTDAADAGDTSSDNVEIAGDFHVLQSLMSVLDPGDPNFDIVVP